MSTQLREKRKIAQNLRWRGESYDTPHWFSIGLDDVHGRRCWPFSLVKQSILKDPWHTYWVQGCTCELCCQSSFRTNRQTPIHAIEIWISMAYFVWPLMFEFLVLFWNVNEKITNFVREGSETRLCLGSSKTTCVLHFSLSYQCLSVNSSLSLRMIIVSFGFLLNSYTLVSGRMNQTWTSFVDYSSRSLESQQRKPLYCIVTMHIIPLLKQIVIRFHKRFPIWWELIKVLYWKKHGETKKWGNWSIQVQILTLPLQVSSNLLVKFGTPHPSNGRNWGNFQMVS